MAEQNSAFDEALRACEKAVARAVRYRVSSANDAEDILQEVWTAAFRGFDRLPDKSAFRPWVLGIASHKCADYYRKRARFLEIPVEDLGEKLSTGRGPARGAMISDALDALPDRDKQILYLFYLREMAQKDIAARLGLPLGTVKSRVHAAKAKLSAALRPPARFPKENAPEPCSGIPKGETPMKHDLFPSYKPPLAIEPSPLAPFEVRLEELPNFFIIPRVGEKAAFAFYDDPDGRLTGVTRMEALRPAEIHGVPCVEILSEDTEGDAVKKGKMYARLTDTRCMHIAEAEERDGVYRFSSFVDDDWLKNYGAGENNAGYETDLRVRGNAVAAGDGVFTVHKKEEPDIIGRFAVTVGPKTYDTVGLLELYPTTLTEKYITAEGRTVLFRRFNRFDWENERYGSNWDEKLPDSDRLTVNGDLYVHWYDCLPDHAL